MNNAFLFPLVVGFGCRLSEAKSRWEIRGRLLLLNVIETDQQIGVNRC
jgi:hypothetical protein